MLLKHIATGFALQNWDKNHFIHEILFKYPCKALRIYTNKYSSAIKANTKV